jgi:hypothetical protein
MLPFKKQEAAISGPVETVQREPDEPKMMELIDFIAEDMIEAIKKGDREALADCLMVFMDHMRMMDEEQDEAMEKEQGE